MNASAKVTDKIDLFTSGAYDNFDTVTSLLPSSYAPPPKVVTTANKYKFFLATTNLEELKLYCFQRKGRANNLFCTKKNCVVNHQGTQYIEPVAPGDVYIAKDKDTAFCTPSISTNLMDEELLKEWLASSNTVVGWTEMMNLATERAKMDVSAGQTEKISTNNFDYHIKQKAKILNFKTPKAKKKQADDSEDDEISLKMEDPIETTKIYNYNPLPFRSLFRMVDERVKSVRDTLSELLKWKKSESVFTAKLSSHVDAMFESLKQMIGSKPKKISSDFDGATLWNILENFAARFSSFDKEIKEKIVVETSGFQASQIALQKQLGLETNERKFNENRFQDCFKKLAPRIENGEKFTLSGLDLLKKQIDMLSNKIDDIKSPDASALTKSLENLNTKTNTTLPVAGNISNDIDDLKRNFEDVKATIRELKAAGDKATTKFGGLFFSSGHDSKAWCEVNLEPNGYGWIFDFHIIMQQVWTNMSGEDLVKRLTKGYKLDIENGHQLATIGSFETPMPRFFNNVHGHIVTQRDQSFFSNVKNWTDWDAPHLGFRDRLSKELEQVRVDHESNIRDNLDFDSPLARLATEALQTSYTWAQGLIKFCDDIYKIYSRAKFGSSVAWHMATRLTRVLILKIAEPRHGVAMLLKASNNAQIGRVTLLASLKSLDLMREIQRLNFENHPTVSNELVKFLSVNTEFQSIKDLQTSTSTLVTEMAALKKEVANLVKGQHTNSNKLDQLKAEAAALVKRVKALEKT